MIEKQTVYLDRNEYNYGPAPEVEKVLRNFDPDKLCFYTRIYDEGKKSILSDYIAELYNIPEKQVILGYGGEDILKQVVHYFLSGGQKQKTLLIPKFSWWYYKSIADEVNGRTIFYPLFEDGNTFKYDIQSIRETVEPGKTGNRVNRLPEQSDRKFLVKEELHRFSPLSLGNSHCH